MMWKNQTRKKYFQINNVLHKNNALKKGMHYTQICQIGLKLINNLLFFNQLLAQKNKLIKFLKIGRETFFHSELEPILFGR